MKIKALVSFSGKLSMHKDEITEYGNKAVLQDLLQAGYVEEVKNNDSKPDNKSKPSRVSKA